MKTWEVLTGDCLEVLKTLGANSIDAVVTDPPYGLGKEPDPIAMLRHWLAGEDYGQDSRGFMGKAWDSFVPGPRVWREVLRVLKPGGHVLAFFGTRTQDLGVLAMRLAGFQIRDSIGYAWVYGQGFPKSLNIGKAIDAAAGASRETIARGYRKNDRDATSVKLGRVSDVYDITAPATPEAAQWEGWGTALKPAWEPIVLARKPLIGTVAANVLAHGTGGLNIDGCRIGTETLPAQVRGATRMGTFLGADGNVTPERSGRWPANVLLDEEAAAMLDAQSGESISRIGGRSTVRNFGQDYADTSEKDRARSGHSDSGGASRFFYTAKASRDERDGGLELLPAISRAEATGRKEGSAGSQNPRAGAGSNQGSRNTHPTVKPVSLMRWLVRLVTPPGGLVLDPFCGSASTGVAALHEGLRFLGIEREAEYVEMARERLTAWAAVHEEFTTIQARASGQMPLFAKANP